MRQQLPQRRLSTTISFNLGGLNYTGSFGCFANDEPAEIFLNADKPNTATDINARDAAIAASLALQFGCPIDILRKALTRNPDQTAAGPLGKFLDLIAES